MNRLQRIHDACRVLCAAIGDAVVVTGRVLAITALLIVGALVLVGALGPLGLLVIPWALWDERRDQKPSASGELPRRHWDGDGMDDGPWRYR